MTIKMQLSSGAKLEFNLAPVDTALELYRAVIAECLGQNFGIEDGDTLPAFIVRNQNLILKLLGSKNVMECAQNCCAKVLYNNQHFSMELFEDEKARGDFFGIMILITLENILPFFPNFRIYFQPIANLFLK